MHCHKPDHLGVEMAKFLHNVKQRVLYTDLKPTDILNEALSKASDELKTVLPNLPALNQRLQRWEQLKLTGAKRKS